MYEGATSHQHRLFDHIRYFVHCKRPAEVNRSFSVLYAHMHGQLIVVCTY